MPFVAIKLNEDGGEAERVDISAVDNPAGLKGFKYVCQLCGAEMICKVGLVKHAHFAHRAKCTSDYQSHPESWEHRLTKLYLMSNLPKLFPLYGGATAMQEVVLHEIKRVADVVFTFPNGWRVVHEVQLSAITTADLAKRTEDYESIGCDVVWWLGRDANTSTNRAWVIEYQQICYELSYERSSDSRQLFSDNI